MWQERAAHTRQFLVVSLVYCDDFARQHDFSSNALFQMAFPCLQYIPPTDRCPKNQKRKHCALQPATSDAAELCQWTAELTDKSSMTQEPRIVSTPIHT
ncbi:hypothetical protein J3458_019624 [Metarhizium acridum]|uniref:uncharacterized protein n=1 Tax=Metarhizium acridum TaxID=92637 RepID=UPI001C6AEA58|nr:hypothetical protein J3458_019624 [Metarhizium acridum]